MVKLMRVFRRKRRQSSEIADKANARRISGLSETDHQCSVCQMQTLNFTNKVSLFYSSPKDEAEVFLQD